MYGVLDKVTERFIAFHEEFDVVESYFNNLEDPEKYSIVKVKNRAFKNFVDGADLYLIEYRGNFIPYKYYESASFFCDEDDYYFNILVGHLERLQETDPNLSKKDLKAIIRVVDILRDRHETESQEPISQSILEEMKLDYDMYQQSSQY